MKESTDATKYVTDWLTWLLWRRRSLLRIGGKSSLFSAVCPATRLAEGVAINGISMVRDSSIGRFTYIRHARISNADVGAFCSIGPAIIGGQGNHPTKWISTHPSFYSTMGQTNLRFVKESMFEESRRVRIGSDVWIGRGAMVLNGSQVHSGAIVAAGAVVTQDVQPYTIVGGVPAKKLRSRFNEDIVTELLDWEWWNLPIQELELLAPQFIEKQEWCLADILKMRRSISG